MLWSNLVQVFDRRGQWGRATLRLVEGNDATAMVQRVETLLEDSMKLLKSHEQLIGAEEYKTFDLVHRRLLLRVIEVKQDVQDQSARNLFSASPAERQAYQSEVHQLYDRAQIYHRDVLTASRRAQEREDESLFSLPENYSSTSLSTDQSAVATGSTTTWYSVISSQTDSSLGESDVDSELGSETSTLVEPFVAVAHVRDSEEDNPEKDDAYRRILIMESRRKRVILIDPNVCYLKDGTEQLNESSLLDISRAGEALFKATDPENLEGYQAIGAQQEPSWVDSMIQSMSRLGVGVGGQMV